MKTLFSIALAAILLACAPAYAQSEKPLVIKSGHQQVLPAGDTLDLTASPLATNIAGLTQCVQANSAGVISGTGSACGTGSGSGTVTSVTCGTGLSGGVITSSGTCSITAPVTVALGGTNATSASGTALDNISGFASTGFLTRTGAGAYSFQSATNGITLGNVAQVAANTVLGNATASTANIAAQSMPSCSAATSALTWTSSSGFGCNSISSGSGTVTHTVGALTSGQLIVGNGTADIKTGDLSGDVGTSGSGVTTIGALKVATGMIQASAVTEGKIGLSNVTTNNVTTSAHGFAPILPNDATKYLDGTGAYSVPAGGSGMVLLLPAATPSGTGVVTFNAIPGSYTHLKIMGVGRSTVAGTGTAFIKLTFNNDTAANYSQQRMFGNGSGSASKDNVTGASWIQPAEVPTAGDIANYGSAFEVTILNYTNTTFTKNASSHYGVITNTTTGSLFDITVSGTWSGTAAITRLDLTLSGGNWVAGSDIRLYGIP